MAFIKRNRRIGIGFVAFAAAWIAMFSMMGCSWRNRNQGRIYPDQNYLHGLIKPIDTWEGIHTFLVQDTFVEEKDFPELSRYDFIWAAGRFNHQHRPPIKPAMLVSGEIPFDRDPNATYIVNDGDHTLDWYKKNRPDWVVYQCDRQTPAYEFGQTEVVPIDISNPAVIDFQVNFYGKWNATHGEDALGANNVSFKNLHGRCGVYRNGQWVQLYSGEMIDPKWASDVSNWTRVVRNRLQALSPPLGLIIGLSPADFEVPVSPQLHELLGEIDGLIESGGFMDVHLKRLMDQAWVRKVEFMREVQSRGLPYYAINEFGPLLRFGDCSPAKAIDRDGIQWVLASYLMAKEHSAAVFISGALQYGCALWFPEFEANVGHPCGEMRSTQEIYERDYSNALTVVNPSGDKTHEVTLPPGKKYIDLYGIAASGKISMPPNSGLVLKLASGPGFCK